MPQVGEKVRVTYEGVAQGPAAVSQRAVRVRTSKQTHVAYLDDPSYTVETIEPEYKPGALYQDAHGEIFQYSEFNGDRPWSKIGTFSAAGRSVPRDYPVRPLVKLVPER